MMTTKIKFNIYKKSGFNAGLPAITGHRFVCAGEGCMIKEKCTRWNGAYILALHSNN